MKKPVLRVVPLTPERWGEFEQLFGTRGACGGCWCMTLRLTGSEYEKNKGAGNRRAMKRLVDSGTPPGLLGFVGKEPVAWCSIEPREAFGRLARSRLLKAVDDKPVWSIVCFFVAKDHRGEGNRLVRPGVATGIMGSNQGHGSGDCVRPPHEKTLQRRPSR